MTQDSKQVEYQDAGDSSAGGRAVLTPKSQITYENCHELKEKIDDAIQRNKTDIILDCKHVGLLDSVAMELLLQTHDELINKGGVLKIVGLNDVCQDILLATRTIHLLFVYKDIHEAVTSSI